MTLLTPYCLRLAQRGQSAVLYADHQSAGDYKEEIVPFLDRVNRWCCCLKGLCLPGTGLFFAHRDGQGKAPMAHTKRSKDHAKTSAAPRRGRRVVLYLSDDEHGALSYFAGRFRLTPQELLRGMLQWLPDQPIRKFMHILLMRTKGLR